MRFPVLLCCVTVVLFSAADSVSAQKSDSLAFAAFQKGREAYQQKNYQLARELFQQARNQSKFFIEGYYLWLGAATEKSYDFLPESEKPAKVDWLGEAAEAYGQALAKNRDPDIHFNYGRLLAKYACERARFALEAVSTDSVSRLSPVTLDSLKNIWNQAETGLEQAWEACLAQERKVHVYALQTSLSDTLEIYLGQYIEDSLKYAELAAAADFQQMSPDVLAVRIRVACQRVKSGPNADWFKRMSEVASLDGGSNMRSVIQYLIGLRQNREGQTGAAFKSLERAISYARSSQAKVALYQEAAFIAYGVDLEKAVQYARAAFLLQPLEEQTKETFGGLLLSQANAKMLAGEHEEAVKHAWLASRVMFKGRAEALSLLAQAYLNSTKIPESLDRAYEAALAAYKLQPEIYWKDLYEVLVRRSEHGRAQVLKAKHEHGVR